MKLLLRSHDHFDPMSSLELVRVVVITALVVVPEENAGVVLGKKTLAEVVLCWVLMQIREPVA